MKEFLKWEYLFRKYKLLLNNIVVLLSKLANKDRSGIGC